MDRSTPMDGKNMSDLEAVERVATAYRDIVREIHKVIVGQDDVVRDLITTLLAGGHCLLVGVPGLAKTLLVKTVADVLDLGFSRQRLGRDDRPVGDVDEGEGLRTAEVRRAGGVDAPGALRRYRDADRVAHVLSSRSLRKIPGVRRARRRTARGGRTR